MVERFFLVLHFEGLVWLRLSPRFVVVAVAAAAAAAPLLFYCCSCARRTALILSLVWGDSRRRLGGRE